MHSITAADIAKALQGRKCGSGWIMHCVAHDDRTRSLSITDRCDKILVNCFAGCQGKAIIETLRGLGLWPERERKPWTRAERLDWISRKDEERHAEAWGRTAAALAELVLEEEIGYVDERSAHSRLLEIVRRGGVYLLAEYREWIAATPDLARAMVAAGQTSDARIQRQLATYIQQLGGERAA